MRQSYHDNGFLIFEEEFIGISLGYDYCAEHEWGIKGIRRKLEIPELNRQNVGVKSRTIQQAPVSHVQYREVDDQTYFSFVASWYQDKPFNEHETYLPYGVYKDFTKELITAWDESGFWVGGAIPESRERIKMVYEAFLNKNLAICHLGSGNPFANSSLSLLIVDRIPKAYLEMMVKADTEGLDLKEEKDKLDLDGKARANKCDFMAISPKFIAYGATPEELKVIKKQRGYDTNIS